MGHIEAEVGNLVKLKNKYEETATYAIIIRINRIESLGRGGWISFDYTVWTDRGQLVNITASCIEKICGWMGHQDSNLE